MGAEQSSQQATSTSAPRKTCYYEALGVDRQANDDEIRKAYKKKALELHPDRNLNDTETATRRFAEVQTAYEILSDAQERAWYDSHRDAILDGHADNVVDSQSEPFPQRGRLTTVDQIFRLMARFNSAVPLTDDPAGFFGILNVTFDALAEEEAAACKRDGVNPVMHPPFGSSCDDYDSVARPFYNVWSSFSTMKSFSWKDQYRLSDAPDRRVRRLMEKENKKLRDEAIRDFNDAVRSLVAFVRKRDPRYVPNTQSEAERQKVLRDSAAAQAARSRAANQAKLAEFVVPNWAQSRGPVDQASYFSVSDGEESQVEHIECVVCNKTFKSEKQFEAHERSKKHQKLVQQVRRQLAKEHADLGLAVPPEPSSPQPNPSGVSESGQGFSDADRSLAETDPNPSGGASPSSHEKPRNRKGTVVGLAGEAGDSHDEDSDAVRNGDDGDCDYAPREVIASRILPLRQQHEDEPLGAEDAVEEQDQVLSRGSTLVSPESRGDVTVGKAKAKRAKKAARQGASTAEQQNATQCVNCAAIFTSRNELFSHLNKTGHAQPPAARLAVKPAGRKSRA